MLFRDVVELSVVSYSQNGEGISTETLSNTREVFANKKSIRQTEFYQAASLGLQPAIMFEIRTTDYDGEQRLSHEGKPYDIIRTFDKNGEILELTCSTVNKRQARS